MTDRIKINIDLVMIKNRKSSIRKKRKQITKITKKNGGEHKKKNSRARKN